LQIVKYRWENWEPFFTVITEDKMNKIRLMDQDISIRTGNRRCIGFFQDGRHFPCPENKIITYGCYCNSCKARDDFFLCIKCDGNDCINPKQRDCCKENNYYVYLAAFDSVLKVGISYEHRLLERLVEQGADFGAKIAFVKDGKNVRTIEQKIKHTLGAVDRMGGDEKHTTLFANPNNSAKSIYKAILKLRNNGLTCLINPEIYDMRKYYKLQNVPVKPEKFEITSDLDIKGRIIAAKGNMMVLKQSSNFFLLNAHRLIGFDVEYLQ
jgi:hypothetical protein